LKHLSAERSKEHANKQNENPTLLTIPPTESVSTETIVNNERPSTNNTDENQARYFATKLDRFHDKEVRFQSHKEFLTRCLEANIIPNGLKLQLEPSIGNHNDEFVNKWYEKLEKFSRELMQDVIEECNTTLTSVNTEITTLEGNLRNQTEETQFAEIKKAITANHEMRKRTLQQTKNKKFYALKYNHRTPYAQTQQTAVETPINQNLSNKATPPTSYAGIVRNRSNTNQTYVRKPPSRKNSRTNLTFGINQKQNTTNDETSQLRERIQQLEQQARSQTHQNQSNPSLTGNTEANIQKNVKIAQNLDKGTTPNVSEMLKYIENTMQTLSAFTKQLMQQQGTSQTHPGM
jgi:hypothetical protein